MRQTLFSSTIFWLVLPMLLVAMAFTVKSTENAAIFCLAKQHNIDLTELTPREVRELTGRKMTIKGVVALKIAQHKIKKSLPSPKSKGKTDWKALIAIISGGLLL